MGGAERDEAGVRKETEEVGAVRKKMMQRGMKNLKFRLSELYRAIRVWSSG